MMRHALLFLLCFGSCEAQSIPRLHVQSLAGAAVDLPSELHGRIGILVVGFSRKSGTNARAWGEAITKESEANPRIVYYQIPVLSEVPLVLRGLVLKEMRHGMTTAEQAHFAPAFEDKAEWKEAVHFTSPDDAYVLVLDNKGIIVWRTQGVMTAVSCRALAHIIEALIK